MRDERRRGSAWPGEPHAIVQVVIENQVQGHVKQAVGGLSFDESSDHFNLDRTIQTHFSYQIVPANEMIVARRQVAQVSARSML
jgi:hypothetical protein